MTNRTSLTQSWLDDRGSLNDARILEVSQTERDVEISIDDEWSNFEGLPEYKGESPIVISIQGNPSIERLDREIFREKISDIILSDDGKQCRFSVKCYGGFSFLCTGDRVFARSRD